jgi:hypothetical protein
MSIQTKIKQPILPLLFEISKEFQSRYKESCQDCFPSIIIPDTHFIPFIIKCESNDYKQARIMDLDDNLVRILDPLWSLVFTNYYDSNEGLFINYFDGRRIVPLTCGCYYLMINIGDVWYYSEMFRMIDHNDFLGQIPLMIYDDYHLPLRIFDNILKQYNYRCPNDCDVTPVTDNASIMPYLFFPDMSFDIADVKTHLVNLCYGTEREITDEIDYEIKNDNPTITTYETKLTAGKTSRNSEYRLYKENYIYQQIRIGHNGKLDSIDIQLNFKGEIVTLEVALIKGLIHSAVPLVMENLPPESHSGIYWVTWDLSGYNIDVVFAEMYMIRISRVDVNSCFCYFTSYIPNNYLWGNTLVLNNTSFPYESVIQFKDNGWVDVPGGDYLFSIDLNIFSDNLCKGIFNPVDEFSPDEEFNIYTATESQTIIIEGHPVPLQFIAHLDDPMVSGLFIFEINSSVGLIHSQTIVITTDPQAIVINLLSSYTVNLLTGEQLRYKAKVVRGTAETTIFSNYYNIVNNSGLLPGLNQINMNMVFRAFVTVENIVGDPSGNMLYQVGRNLDSNLDCGNYYLRIEIGANIWYSDIFKVVNMFPPVTPEEEELNYLEQEDTNDLIYTEGGQPIEL